LISAAQKFASSKFKKKLKGIPIPMELILGTDSRNILKLFVMQLVAQFFFNGMNRRIGKGSI